MMSIELGVFILSAVEWGGVFYSFSIFFIILPIVFQVLVVMFLPYFFSRTDIIFVVRVVTVSITLKTSPPVFKKVTCSLEVEVSSNPLNGSELNIFWSSL